MMENSRETQTCKTAGTPVRQNYMLGIGFILIAAFCFSLMTLFVRLSGDLPTMEKAFFRNVVALAVAFFMLLRSADKFHIRKESWPSIAMRCLFGTTGLICNFYAIDHMNIADANMLNKLSPFFAILISIPVMKEKPGRKDWAAVLIAFLGALFIIKPGAGIASLPALIGLYGGFGAGTAYAFVRRLGKIGERTAVIVFCFSAFSCMLTAPFLVFQYVPMNEKQLLSLLLAGLSASAAQFAITAAYRLAPARIISVFDYTQVLFATLWGLLFFGEVPDALSFIGYAVIIGTAVARVLLVEHGNRKNSPESAQTCK